MKHYVSQNVYRNCKKLLLFANNIIHYFYAKLTDVSSTENTSESLNSLRRFSEKAVQN
jgi:hypothetical protein